MKTFHRIIFILFLVLIDVGVFAQKTMYRTIGHQTEGSEGRNVAQTEDGGFLLTYYVYYASSYVACITKLNCAGIKEWENFYSDGMVTLPVEIIPQTDNGFLQSFSIQTTSGDWQHVISRFDGTGKSIWTKRLNMRVGNTTGCMVQDTDGSIYVCGSVEIASTGFNGTAIVKLNSSGQIIWEKHYGEFVDHTPRLITVTSDHKVVVAGQIGIPTFIFTNIFVFSIDKNGNFLKRKILTTTYDDEALSICADKVGNVAITGYSYFLSTAWDFMFVKLDPQLNVIQSKYYDGGSAQGEQARYIIASMNNTFTIFGDEGGFNERNPALIKVDADGNILTAKHYTISPQFTNYIFHGAQCSDGGFLLTGDARPASQFRIAPFLRTNADGELGCYTGPLSLIVRNETLTEFDTSLFEFTVGITSDTISILEFTALPTSNTPYCQSLTPCGNFMVTQDSVCPKACYTFNANTFIADTWNWTFDNGTPSSSTSEQPPQVCYDIPGPHIVEMTLTNAFGTFSYSQTVNPTLDCPLLIPNIFTPGSDGLNDEFVVEGISDDFELLIFNRWGLEIFKSDFPGKWWNGSSSKGEYAPDGVYFYLLKLKNNAKQIHGTVQLLRD